MKKSIYKVVLCYLISIVLFAAVYWFFWMKNTSYFMVNQEFNTVTFAPMFFDEEVGSLPRGKEKTVIETNEVLQSLHLSIDSLNKAIKRNKNEQNNYNRFLDALNDQLWDSYKINSQLAVKNGTKEVKQKIDSLEHSLQIMTFASGSDIENTSPVVVAETKLKLARLRLQEAKIIAAVLNKKFETYFDKQLYSKNVQAGKRDSTYRIRNINMLSEINKIQLKIYNVVVDFHSKRFEKLNYFDFLYFSAGIATSSNFGDILPNTRLIRVIVFVQILLSLVQFGWLINQFVEAFDKKYG
ncbi:MULTISPECIES: potassium channel family protein [unclassified Pedobacter]|uniref:potassium channel family protein n=1 Tax=unclassified Pedobacter TaxID=2628915 RepID=UPI001420F713|nr:MULTISPECIES: potassium channel family protein [unclassified Pedobacter]NII83490.1 hypothetical protein [Pedobacter sp. SG908]NMN37354.1 hypothetical protein [Pedobacter sp. SG918]